MADSHMKKYNVTFIGRIKNSIGKIQKLYTSIVSEEELNEEGIRVNLYKEFEHISEITFKEVDPQAPYEGWGDHLGVDKDIEMKHGL
jgi:hypothetical protein